MKNKKDSPSYDNFTKVDVLGLAVLVIVFYCVLFVNTNKIEKTINYGTVIQFSGESNTAKLLTGKGDTLTVRVKDEVIESIINCSEHSDDKIMAQYHGVFMSHSIPEISHVFTENEYASMHLSPLH